VAQINHRDGSTQPRSPTHKCSSSEELAATAEEMSGQAEQLQQLVGFFKVDGAESSMPVPVMRRAKAGRLAHRSAKASRSSASGPVDESAFPAVLTITHPNGHKGTRPAHTGRTCGWIEQFQLEDLNVS